MEADDELGAIIPCRIDRCYRVREAGYCDGSVPLELETLQTLPL